MHNSFPGAIAYALLLVALLTGALVALKLLKIVTWSWWWVMTPVWGPIVAIAAIVVLCVVIGLVNNLRHR